jgi:hypothetical protein
MLWAIVIVIQRIQMTLEACVLPERQRACPHLTVVRVVQLYLGRVCPGAYERFVAIYEAEFVEGHYAEQVVIKLMREKGLDS